MIDPFVIGFYGYSNSGKTKLITELISYFSEQSITVASIKQTTHSYSLDNPGKDTWKHAEAGAKITCLQSEVETSVIIKKKLSIKKIINMITKMDTIDLIFVEGASDPFIQKIRVDDNAPVRQNTVFTFNGDIYKVCAFIEEEMKKRKNV